jgi:hypothetical protein
MPPEVVPLWLNHSLIVATCLLAFFFAVAYTVKRQWWKYQMGWNLFVMRVGIGFVLLPFTLHELFGISVTSPFYQWFSTVVFVLVPAAIFHIIYLLFADPADNDEPMKSAAPDSVRGLRLKRRYQDGAGG